MKLVNWNVNWATPRSKRSPEILDRINQHSPEIVCLTEAHVGFLQGGHAICAGADYGYGIQKSRRKVLLWSRSPWEHVDNIGDARLPPGRLVSGVTRTSLGELTRMLHEGRDFVFSWVVWLSLERFRRVVRRWKARRVGMERRRGAFQCFSSRAGDAKRNAALRDRIGGRFRGGGRRGDAIRRSAVAPGAGTRLGPGTNWRAAPRRYGYFG